LRRGRESQGAGPMWPRMFSLLISGMAESAGGAGVDVGLGDVWCVGTAVPAPQARNTIAEDGLCYRGWRWVWAPY